MKALVIVCALAGAADARPFDGDVSGGAWLHYELTGLAGLDKGRFDDVVLAGARLHGFIGGKHLGYHVGFDFALGATAARASGFAYEVTLLPVGVATRFGDTQMIGVAAGVGALGAVGTLDDATTFPVEAFAELGLGGRLRVLARARYSFLAGAPGHADDATLGVRLGHRYDEYAPSGNGYFVGVAARELAGDRYVGVVIGYSIDLASPRR